MHIKIGERVKTKTLKPLQLQVLLVRELGLNHVIVLPVLSAIIKSIDITKFFINEIQLVIIDVLGSALILLIFLPKIKIHGHRQFV